MDSFEDEFDERIKNDVSLIYKGLMRSFDVSKPIIAAVKGYCVAGGMEMLQATDIRVAAEDARFAIAEVKHGLFPMGGSTARLARQSADEFAAGAGRAAFVAGALGGVAIGLVVGWVIAAIRERTTDTQVSITISLLSGYAAFVPADALGASGVLAVVTAGIYMGIRGPSIIPARTRLQGFMVWDILDFLINATLFVLVGLQLHTVVDGLSGRSAGSLIAQGAAVAAVVVGGPAGGPLRPRPGV